MIRSIKHAIIERRNESFRKVYDHNNTYDKDGNILTLERFNGSGSQTDDFSYTYYTAQGGIKTNKLRKVSGSSDQFTYDGNCNMITDALNSNTNIQYDHRNLITQIQKLNTTIEPIQNQFTIIRRMLSEAKSRPVGNHLGSIRVIIDPDRQVLSANDFDPWEYYLDNRGYEMVPENETPDYKFTSKDRDRESNYDYFGARYYDSRIGRWGQVESLMDKYISSSTYCYGLNNPIVLIDPNGRELILGGDKEKALNDIKSILPVTEGNRITVENDIVSFDTDGLNIASDAAYELLNNIITSENKYLYEVSNIAQVVIRDDGGSIPKGGILEIILDEKTPDMVNASTTPRNIDGGFGNPSYLPKDDLYSQITIGTGKWRIPNVKNSNVTIPRSDVVFHELAEAYFRTDKKQPYTRIDGSGAHKMAIDYTKNYSKQSSSTPGEVGGYIP